MTLKLKIKATAYLLIITSLTLLGGMAFGVIIRQDKIKAEYEQKLEGQRIQYGKAYRQIATSETVLQLMLAYQCSDQEIYQAIMDQDKPGRPGAVLVARIIAIESSFEPDAISPKNCRGLMGVSPELLLDNWQNPRLNIITGSNYLCELTVLLKRFYPNISKAEFKRRLIAAYNAGPQKVILYGGVPPYFETREYLRKLRYMGEEI